MEAAIAGVVAGLGALAAWLDLRRKMNGSGSIAQKEDLARLEGKVDDALDWQLKHLGWHLENMHKMQGNSDRN